CGQVGSIDYLDNIACSSTQPFRCGDTVTALTNAGLGNRTREGTRCLIHADNDGVCQNQDYFGSNCGDTIASNPATITGGGNNPNPSLQGVTNISRSDSLATVPLYDGHNLCAAGCTTATIVGFLQLGLTYTSGAGPSSLVHGVILNASGCNPGASGTAVAGGGISPVPVRLIHQ